MADVVKLGGFWLACGCLALGATACSEDGDRVHDARDYGTIRASFLEGGKPEWCEIPGEDPDNAGAFRRMKLSTFGTEELLSGASAAMSTVASRLLYRDGEGIDEYFAEGFTGPALDGSNRELERDAFLEALRDHVKAFDRVRDVRLKPVQARPVAEGAPELRVDLKVTVLGRVGRTMRMDRIKCEADVGPVDALWRFTHWGPVEIQSRSSDELHFVERTEEVGLTREFEDLVTLPDGGLGGMLYVNGGLAVEDVDADGDMDVYVPRAGANLFFENDGTGEFEEEAAARGLADEGHGHGAVFADLDGDGALDLYVANNSVTYSKWPSALYWRRAGKYAPAPADSGVSVEGFATAVAVTDFDRDGDLDVYVGRYGDLNRPFSYRAARNGQADVLLRNGGDGSFADVASEAGIENTGWTLAATWSDYDADGDQDLYISNDFGPNELHRNEGDGTFENVAGSLGTADLGNGMGANWVDYDNDGDLDLYSVNMYSTAGKRVLKSQLKGVSDEALESYKKMARGNTLFRNAGDAFEDVSAEAGCQNAGWSWGTEFFDYDNDGDLDMLITNGYWSAPRQHDL